MKQVIRQGLKEIIVDEVPDPPVAPHHVLVRPLYSLISSGTETASIHQEGVLKEVAENPSHLRKIWEALKVNGPVRTTAEVIAKFSEYAVLGYSGAGVVVIATYLRPERVKLARKLGADHALSGVASVIKATNSLTEGKGADCVIIAVAHPEARE
jgi:hypothetical protein